MRFYCTYFDSNYLTRGLALHRSLQAHGGDFELIVLCMDDAVEADLRARALPRVRLLPISELIGRYPRLASARGNRTKLEFYFTCTSWLMLHLLPQIPAGQLLTYLDADLYFFSSPEPIYDEIGTASIAITPHRFPPSLAHLERYGRFNVGWVSLRHDHTGLACAADWSEKCAAWCFNRLEGDRYADQKYLDAWAARYPGTVSLAHPGVNAAPWNIKDCLITSHPSGPRINGESLIFYHFHALSDLGRQLFDPGLHRYDASLTPELRDVVYRPYLSLLAPAASGEMPEVLPPVRSDDPRYDLAVFHLLEQLRASELDRATRLESLEENRITAQKALDQAQAATEQTIAYLRLVEADRDAAQHALGQAHAATAQTIDYLKLVEADRDRARAEQQQTIEHFRAEQQQTLNYLKEVEKDSADRLSSIHYYQDKLKTAYADLERNVAYLKTLEAEIAAHAKVSADKDAIIARLAEQLRGATETRPHAS